MTSAPHPLIAEIESRKDALLYPGLPVLAGLSGAEINALLPPNLLLLGYRGSIAHGMYRNPEQHAEAIDDKDLLGVAVGPIDAYWGLGQFEQRERQYKEWDSVVYEIRKMIRLLAQGNPNVLALLWLEPHHYLVRHALGTRLIDARKEFLTRKMYHAFVGYAHGQLKRMTHFGDQAFTTGYLGAKRKALVAQHGYDTKNAAHLIRILRMGIEAMVERRLIVQRPDAAQLMEIKLGHWTLDQVKAEADHLFKRAEAVYDTCTLPTEPDASALRNLCVGIIHDWFRQAGWLLPG